MNLPSTDIARSAPHNARRTWSAPRITPLSLADTETSGHLSYENTAHFQGCGAAKSTSSEGCQGS